MSRVHDVAASGFGEGTNELYDRARPSYPAEAITKIHQSLRTSTPWTILEPGAGTGIFTRLLLNPPSKDYPTWNITSLIGVEPSSGMRKTWQQRLEEKISPKALEGKKVTIVDGGFDDFSKTGVEPGSVDLVVIAQAWHWCPDHEKALTEISHYLSPQGTLAFIWNLEANKHPLGKSIRALYEPYDKGSPQYYRMLWRKCFDTKAYSENFEKPEEYQTEWDLGMTEDTLVDRIFSKSYMTESHLHGQARIDFEAELRNLIRKGDKPWIDEEKGIFDFKYSTDVVIMQKKQK